MSISQCKLLATIYLIFLVISSGFAVTAQEWNWEKYHPIWPEARSRFAWGWDYERNVAVMFGGGGWLETREWDGENWHQPDIMNLPDFPDIPSGATRFHTMTFDPNTRQMMLAHEWTADIRLYDGSTWTNGVPLPISTEERVIQLAGDSVNSRVYALVKEIDEEWPPDGLRILSWDGLTWSEFSDPIPFMIGCFIGVNSSNGNILVGGEENDTTKAYLWDGSSWTDISPTHNPSIAFSSPSQVAFDPVADSFVIHSGVGGDEYNQCQTVTLAGNIWARFPHDNELNYPGMIFDGIRTKVIRFGGCTDWYWGTENYQLNEWTGTQWNTIPVNMGSVIEGSPFYDAKSDRMLLLRAEGSYPSMYYNTYEWNETNWDYVPGLTQIPYVSLADVLPVWDPETETAVLVLASCTYDGDTFETWVWSDGDWTKANPATSPEPRSKPLITFDPNLGKVIMLGGRSNSNEELHEMWAFDGTTWEMVSLNTFPEIDYISSWFIGTDSYRNRVVISSQYTADIVWEWDGQTWYSIEPSTLPQQTQKNRFFVYVPPLKRLLMVQHRYFYPRNSYGGNHGIYIWNGGDWVEMDCYEPDYWYSSSFQPVWDGKNNELIAYNCYIRTSVPGMACPAPGVSIWMPSHHYQTGDWFSCEVSVCHPDPVQLKNHPLFVILEVADEFFFAPGFTEYENYLHLYPEFSPGETLVDVIDSFQWPDGAGTFDDARFYAALTDPGMQTIVGNLDIWEFSWEE